ncbi:MAG: AAA family ATPase, partial [Clostridia bacterium]|nr:AAA family ATPase [Clostridia bacterium]
MILKTLTLRSFGKYKEVALSLDQGLNVLYGANGAGKSTLIQFLLWMFYDPQHGKRTLREKLRERFRPWDGSALWGELEFTHNGMDYRMERFYDTPSKKRFAVYHGVTGDEVTEEFLPTPGEVLFGFGQGAFLRTFFVGQLSSPFEKEGKEDELQAALMNLSTSGNETVSAQKAEKAIDDAARPLQLKSGKGGLIGASEEKLDRLYALMDERRRKEAE